jgi:hypothetical protein
MVIRRARVFVAASVIVASCGWELPAPDVRRDTTPMRVDVFVPPFDAGPRDVPDVSDRSDVAVSDVVDATVVSDIVAPDVRDVPDVSDVRDVTDVPDVPDGACLPEAMRNCFTGNPDRIGVGYCRYGRQMCGPTGQWATRCDNEIVPDCVNRRCGSDGCEGLCGECPGGTSCDPTGTCTATACGAANFTVPCGGGRCPANSECSATNRCVCAAGYEARVCSGDRCPPSGCSGFDWWCAPAPFCGSGAILCPGMYLCPRWSLCDDATRSCYCRPGFTAQRCDGTACTVCPGTAYQCVPIR